ncbi:MAG: glycosyltransferase, partial [Kiritimatiellia bacterium]
TIHTFDEPFNYSRLHNRIVRKVDCETLIFLNNDVEIINPDWIECLYEHLQRERVAAVGCQLLRSDGSLQHAGITFQPSILSCATNITAPDHFVYVQREVSGVTAACMMIRRSVFLEIGGFDEIDFPIGFSDA